MQRRKAIQQLGLSFGSVITLPAWANAWSKETFKIDNNKTLEFLISAIIPEGEEPGAQSLGVHLFVNRIVKDCYDVNVNNLFDKKLEKVSQMAKERKNKSLDQTSEKERQELLLLLENSNSEDDKNFYSLLKNLTVRGYTSSEYYLTTHRNFELAPGYFHGCVSV